jgi:hypothetical protein
MERIDVVRKPPGERPGEPDISQWREWTIDEGRFIRHYGGDEFCYILEGEALIAVRGGSSIEIREGDLISVPAGLSCTWTIRKKVRVLYQPCPLYNTFI